MSEESNMRIWDAVCTTDPGDTKHVNQRGGFTAINAQSQVMSATRQFGPMGEGWGVNWEREESPAELFLVKVTLWYHGEDGMSQVHQYGCCKWGSNVDDDAPKKAVTDGTTKCLSLLGFNADVFLGKGDDNKYVSERKKEEAKRKAPEKKTEEPELAEGMAKREQLVRLWDLAKQRIAKLELNTEHYNADMVVRDSMRNSPYAGIEPAKYLGIVKEEDLSTIRAAIDEWQPPKPVEDF